MFSEFIKKMIDYGLENVIGRYYSKYRAYVYNNEDPLSMNRLQLLVPHLNPNVPDETWAYPSVFSGKDYGIHLLPKKGDLVWVEYEFGNLDYPIWSMGHYGESEKPTEFDNDDKIGIKTKAGNIILIDDTEESEKIIIRLYDGDKWIELNNNKLVIEGDVIEFGVNSVQPILKGTTTRQKIEELMDKVKAISDALITHSHPTNGAPPSNAATFTQISGDVTTLKNSMEEVLSEKSFTE